MMYQCYALLKPGFKEYMGNDSLNLHGFNLERKYRKMDELEALHVI